MQSANEAVIELKQTAIGSFALELGLRERIPVSLTPLPQVVAGLVPATLISLLGAFLFGVAGTKPSDDAGPRLKAIETLLSWQDWFSLLRIRPSRGGPV